MLARITTVICLCGVTAAAQDLRLVDHVREPLVYLCAQSDGERGAAAFALLEDPELVGLIGLDRGGPARAALGQLRELLDASEGEIELAMTGLEARSPADLPHLVGRARLSESGAEILREALVRGGLAEPAREIAGQQVYRLRLARSVGSPLELALLGCDLLVGNHPDAMTDLVRAFSPDREQFAEPDPQVAALASDTTYQSLRSRLSDAQGSVLVYLNWQRLWRRLESGLSWTERVLLESFGLTSTRHILIGVRPVDGGFVTTALLDQEGGPGGLLSAVREVPLRQLLQVGPPSGLASLTLSIEPELLRDAGRAGPQRLFQASVVGGCRRMGLDFHDQVLPRLGRSASCRLVLLEDGDEVPRAAFSVRARSRGAALGLYADLREILRVRGVEIDTVGKGSHESLDAILANGSAASIGVIGDSVVLGLYPELVPLIELREPGRAERSRQRRDLQRLVQPLEAARGKVAGVFHLGGVPEAAGRDKAPVRVGRHAGLLRLDDGLLRIEMFTRRE